MRMLIVLCFAFVISYDATASDVAASGPRSTITRIPDANTTAFKSNAGPVFFNADSQEQSYVTVNLVAFDIAKDERLWRDYEPLVEVRVRIGDSEFAKVLGPSQIHSTGTRVRSVNNELILGPIPYDGREAVVTVNLRRAAVRDRLGETMSAAQSVAGAFGVGDVVEFTKVSQSLIGVFNKYFAPDSVGVVSFRKTWVPWSPSDPNESSTFREGYYAIHPQSARLDSTKFGVDDDDRVSYAGLPLHRSGTDIAIIRFNHSVERRDYRTRPFYGKYDVAQVAAKSQSVAEFDRAFDSAMSVGSSRVDLQACKLEYSIVSPK